MMNESTTNEIVFMGLYILKYWSPMQVYLFISSDQEVSNRWSCAACGNTIATKEGYHVNGPINMYELPCAHMVCRSCLLLPEQKKIRKCSTCHKSFDASQVVKVHLQTILVCCNFILTIVLLHNQRVDFA